VIRGRRGGLVAAGGIVHDTSSTGGTLFVEPPAAVAFGNRIRELESEEIEEVERILREITDALRPHRDVLAATLDALVVLDTLHARARFGERFA
jgi:DNA mismatch repair protein MutS2